MESPQDALRQRIKILIDELEGGVQRKLALAIGVHATTIGEILGKRKNQPSSELLYKIAKAYPQLRTEWLLLGEGEMLKTPPTEDIGIKNSAVSAKPLTINTPLVYEAGPAITHEGRTVPTFRAKSNKAPEPPGTDLVRQVAKNTREIELVQQSLETVLAELRQLHTK